MALVNGEYFDFGNQDIKARDFYNSSGQQVAEVAATTAPVALTDSSGGATANAIIAALTTAGVFV